MKNRLTGTISRYTDKCRNMKRDLTSQSKKSYHVATEYGGAWYFYKTLMEKGYLIQDDEKNVKWQGNLPSEKEMRRIIRHTNTLTRNGKKPAKSSNRHRIIKTSKASGFISAIQPAPANPTINLLISGIESEIAAHRSNGVDRTHLENIAKYAAAMIKVTE